MTDLSLPPLPEGTLLLHLGPQKTGSTALQASLHENRAALAAQGVLYPGSRVRDPEAGWAVLGTGAAVGRPAPRQRAWTDLVAELTGSPLPRACLSNEDFARADDDAVGRIVDALGAERLHLVFVARRLDKLLPSHWQERVKARMTLDFDAFLHHALDEPDRDWESRVTWEPHDVERTLGRWAQHVDRSRITVVVADEDDRGLLPHTFEDLLGLTRGTLAPPRTSNASLTFTQTETLRRVNELARQASWTSQQYWRIVQGGVVKALRQAAPDDGPRITGLPGWAHPLVADRADAQAEALLAAGVRVVGDPQTLRIRDVAPAPVPDPIDAVSLDLLATVVLGAVDGADVLHRNEARAEPPQLGGRELLRLLAGRTARRLGLR